MGEWGATTLAWLGLAWETSQARQGLAERRKHNASDKSGARNATLGENRRFGIPKLIQ